MLRPPPTVVSRLFFDVRIESHPNSQDSDQITRKLNLVGGRPTPLKNMSSSSGMMTFHSQQSWKSEPCSRKTTNQKWSQRCDFIPYIPQALPGGSQLCPGTTCLQDVGRFRGGVGLISFTCVSLDGGSMEVPPNHPFYVFSNNSMP